MRSLFAFLLLIPAFAKGADFCVTGTKGTITQAFIFKVSQTRDQDRSLSVLNVNRDSIFQSRVENRFIRFNDTGYGTCSIIGSGTDDSTGANYKVELKTNTHTAKECDRVTLPSRVEYLSLKITPKGTTLGDDMTSYSLSIIPCP